MSSVASASKSTTISTSTSTLKESFPYSSDMVEHGRYIIETLHHKDMCNMSLQIAKFAASNTYLDCVCNVRRICDCKCDKKVAQFGFDIFNAPGSMLRGRAPCVYDEVGYHNYQRVISRHTNNFLSLVHALVSAPVYDDLMGCRPTYNVAGPHYQTAFDAALFSKLLNLYQDIDSHTLAAALIDACTTYNMRAVIMLYEAFFEHNKVADMHKFSVDMTPRQWRASSASLSLSRMFKIEHDMCMIILQNMCIVQHNRHYTKFDFIDWIISKRVINIRKFSNIVCGVGSIELVQYVFSKLDQITVLYCAGNKHFASDLCCCASGDCEMHKGTTCYEKCECNNYKGDLSNISRSRFSPYFMPVIFTGVQAAFKTCNIEVIVWLFDISNTCFDDFGLSLLKPSHLERLYEQCVEFYSSRVCTDHAEVFASAFKYLQLCPATVTGLFYAACIKGAVHFAKILYSTGHIDFVADDHALFKKIINNDDCTDSEQLFEWIGSLHTPQRYFFRVVDDCLQYRISK